MFNRSAFDNIRYGKPDATQAEVIPPPAKPKRMRSSKVCRTTRGRSGYDAHLGANVGDSLSGGNVTHRRWHGRDPGKTPPILYWMRQPARLDSEVEASIQKCTDPGN